MFRARATEVAEKIKAEVGKAGQYVTAAIAIAAVALVIAVAALAGLMMGARARVAGQGR
jgi:hypothetical protein